MYIADFTGCLFLSALKSHVVSGILIILQKIWKVIGLGNITFQEIMEFYPAHNRSVYEDLKKDFQNGCMIPFVGAGLSIFCGYLRWPQVLRQLAGFVYDRADRSGIESLIADGELLQAAQEIYHQYPRMLRELQKLLDYDKIQSCDTEKLYASAVYVLPLLFHDGIVMTTNFDRVLEEVYDRHHKKFGKIISPYEPDLLTQMRQCTPHCLFKLHGDIGPEIRDIERMVFTREQYDKAYADNGPLMKELPHWFQNRRLLFLGCSLEKDRTMEVLQQVSKCNAGLDHYAILACKPEDIGQRSRELGNLGISPICYPDGRHEAVRVLLERLLEETRCGAYIELKSHSKEVTPKAESRFMYNSGYIRFTGREQEMGQLEAFCQDAALVSWWAVTGPGGMGKSRLMYEFTRLQNQAGWEICWLEQKDYSKLSDLPLPGNPCIVVADDVQSHLQNIGTWLASVLECERSEKLRILLLEREGGELDSARWADMMQADFPYEDTIPSRCYCFNFLQLKSLSVDELKNIMTDFAAASDKALTEAMAESLMKTLQKIDGDLQRPIYALAITDAWCHGKDPAKWDKEKILDELVKRELRFYYERLRNLSPGRISNEMRSEFENIVAQSCVMPGLLLELIHETEYPKLCKRAQELDMDFSELLRQMGIVHKMKVYVSAEGENAAEDLAEHEVTMEAVLLDCPDLVKEYLVLKQAFDKKRMPLLLPDGWYNNFMQMFFLHKAFVDYTEKFMGQVSFWETFWEEEPKDTSLMGIYGYLLNDIIILFEKFREQAINRLEKIYQQSPEHKETATVYAQGLFNQTVGQPLEKRTESVGKLRSLYEQYPNEKEIALAYAKGLVNQSAMQPLEKRTENAEKLRNLYEQYEDEKEMAQAYAKGLVNQIARQSSEEMTESVEKLRSLYEQYPNETEMAQAYAQGLLNQTIGQPLEEMTVSVERLRSLHEQYQDEKEIAQAYAKGLLNQISEQPLEKRVEGVETLRSLHEQYQDEKEMAQAYAQGLVSLTVGQPLEGVTVSVEKLRSLYEQYKKEKEIALEYAKSLVNLSFAQTVETDVKDTLQQTQKLLTLYSREIEMQVLYAQAYFNLTLVQKADSLFRTVEKLREFLLQHPGANQEFQMKLDAYLVEHPDQEMRYQLLRCSG